MLAKYPCSEDYNLCCCNRKVFSRLLALGHSKDNHQSQSVAIAPESLNSKEKKCTVNSQES